MPITAPVQAFRGGRTTMPPNIPLPPQPLPLLRAGRLRKQWRYVSLWSRDLMICAGSVAAGPARQEFWAIWDRGAQRLWERTRLWAARVHLSPGRLHVREPDIRIEVVWEENEGFETVTCAGRAYTWTRKQIVHAEGVIYLHGTPKRVDATALIDDNAGYHPRHTQWRWCGGAGTTTAGRPVAWSVIVGLNDALHNSERTLWVDSVPAEVGPVHFAEDLSAVHFAEGGTLHFQAEAVRQRNENLVLIRSRYCQPFGSFQGTLPGGHSLAEGYGVMEWHEAVW